MAIIQINVGSAPGNGSGEPLRAAMEKINANFAGIEIADVAGLQGALNGLGGGGPAGYATTRTAAANGSVTDADALGLVIAAGTELVLTLKKADVPVGGWVDVLNLDDTWLTLDGDGDDINASGTTSIMVGPRQLVRVIRAGAAKPYWLAAALGGLDAGPNATAVVNDDGTALEARAEKVGFSFVAPVDGNATFATGVIWPGALARLTDFELWTTGGACDVQVQAGGAAIDGFGTAVAITTSRLADEIDQEIQRGAEITITVTNADNLTGVAGWFAGVRIAP